MDWIEALILGVVQGLTEFLPISSSGHIELGKYLLDVEAKRDLTFTVLVHGATVLSIIFVFYKDIADLFRGLFKKDFGQEKIYILKLLLSMVPVGIVGLFFEQQIEQFFFGNIKMVGIMLIVTSVFLLLTLFAKKKHDDISAFHALIIGIAQAIAVLPGISRSGITVASGLLLGNDRVKMARFSFLMVLLPIAGANFIKISGLSKMQETGQTDLFPLIIGFLAALISGIVACRWMIKIIRNGKLAYFAIYCFLAGSIAIITQYV